MPAVSRHRFYATALLLLAIPLLAGGGRIAWQLYASSRPSAIDLLERSPARLTDLHVSLRAPGLIQSSSNVEIECELENVSVNSEGRTFSARAASTIIEILPEGTMVKKGDVLCRLDSSEFEELLRQQEIKVLQARADAEKAVLDLKAAEIAFKEYREGVRVQERQELDAELTLAKVEIERQRDRIDWTKKMVGNGYMSEGQLIREEQLMLRSSIALARLQTQIKNHVEFRVPMNTTRLEAALERARMEVSFQEVRLRRREEQLANVQRQVERCTIRAPHSGILTYAEDDDDPKIQLGAAVHQRMDLFVLPDLEKMQVVTALHETVLDRVKPGMTARVRVEALPHHELEGQVVNVGRLPVMDRNRRASIDVKNYSARVQLLTVPPSLKPGMTAEVEIVTAHHPQAIVVPTESVSVVDGREVCYVANDGVLERRPVTVAPGTPELVHITEGLREGDEVVLNPDEIAPEIKVVDVAIEEPDELPVEPEPTRVALDSMGSAGTVGYSELSQRLTP